MKKIKIFGSPGAGKTTRLLNLLVSLLQVYSPKEIAFVSFTRKGAYEGKERALEKFGFSEEDTPYFKTLHSLIFGLCRINSSDIIQKEDYRDLSKLLNMKFLGYYTEELQHNDDAYLFWDQMRRNNPVAAEKMTHDLEYDKLLLVKKNYAEFKKKNKLLDFTDIIEMGIEKNISVPVKVAIIDEAQDLTTLQWKMVEIAFRDCETMYIAGDDDQAIYEWSGADVNYFLGIKADEQIILDQTYRLPDNILEFSNKISAKIKNRVAKEIKGTGRNGQITTINDLQEIKINNEQSYLFLSRNNYYLKSIKEYFEKIGMPYNYKNEPQVKKEDFEAIRQWQILKTKDRSFVPSMLRLHLKKELDYRLDWFDNLNWPLEKISYYRNIIKNGVHNQDNLHININVNTIHTVKGGEADNVIVLEDMTKSCYNNLQKNPDAENRIFYVAVTRAKQNLYILQSKSNYKYNF
jgi:DNA helicase-2/ATP-dependent DNA helicase PcrA